MRHFLNRDDLVDLVGECPRSTIQRAVLSGRVKVLGLFTRAVEDDTRHAWIFRVIGIKKEWIVAALMTVRGPKFRILKKVPWQWWDGHLGSLTGGDDPIIYAMRCNHAIKTKADADKTGE